MEKAEKKPINLQRFLDDFNDRKTAMGILNRFVARSIDNVHKLRTELAHNNHREFHRIVHSLKGGAMNINASGMCDQARSIEQIYKKNNFFEAGLPDNLKEEISQKLSSLEGEISELSVFVKNLG